jgi:hypothetical protein
LVILKNISKDKKLSQNFDYIKNAIQKDDIYLLKESRIVFTCGAAEEDDYMKTRRGILMQYAKKNIKGINFFTAETLFDTMEDHKTTDLLSIESKLANYSDCILIILESPGAFTELGAFSHPDRLAEKILVINNKQFQNQDSFINQGPIKKIDKISEFKKCIYADFENMGASINEVSKRINKLTYQKRRKINISNQVLIEEEDKYRFYLLHDLISIMYPISHSELIALMKNIYGDLKKNVNFDLDLLTALDLIEKYNGYYIKKSSSQSLFLQYSNFNYDLFRSGYLIRLKKTDSRLFDVSNYYGN